MNVCLPDPAITEDGPFIESGNNREWNPLLLLRNKEAFNNRRSTGEKSIAFVRSSINLSGARKPESPILLK